MSSGALDRGSASNLAMKARSLTKAYDSEPPVEVLRGVNLDVERGERVAIVGPSGAGKSTLLNILGLLDEPSGGSLEILGSATHTASPARRDKLRSELLGFVFQDAHVLGHRTVAENIELKLAIRGVPRRQRFGLIAAILARVGLNHRSRSLGRLLSGGEKQRLAIARALVTTPGVLLADEPTGNLDDSNAGTVLELFDEAAKRGVAVLVITHDSRIADWADSSYLLIDGVLSTRK